jgi:hypothetical protein
MAATDHDDIELGGELHRFWAGKLAESIEF